FSGNGCRALNASIYLINTVGIGGLHHAPFSGNGCRALNASIYLINTVGIGGLHHAYPARADHFADL
ncbi:hypothetical protein, partial [Shigella sonnei]|uniref:hypothetical protein n=1 Tax=Shigella sonnei TaxID=624 RepID=UPI001C0A7C24